MQLTNTFTEVIISSVPSTLKNNGSTDIEIAFSKDVPTKGDYSLAPNQYFNVEDSSLKLWVRAKLTEGTVTLLNFRHLEPLPPLFLGSQPHPSLVLGVHATPQGLFSYNRFDDKMPIKTINMAGLQKWEETDDYIIYLDKDAVMTTVESYVTGTYDLFLERKADIDGSMELLRANEIEWTSEDDSKLILDINKAQLERIANTPTTMEEDAVPQTFTTRSVPTTYECCFRVDKKTGEIYIGEGYENLCNYKYYLQNMTLSHTTSGFIATKTNALSGGTYANDMINHTNLITGETYSATVLKSENSKGAIVQFHTSSFDEQKELPCNADGSYSAVATNKIANTHLLLRNSNTKMVKGDTFEFKAQITKTSTPKPFVKSIMPSGKLAFVTPATSETHSFVMKDFKSIRFYHCSNSYNWNFETAQIVRSDADNNTKIYDVAISKTCRIAKRKPEEVVRQIDIINVGKTDGTLTFSWRRQPQDAPDGTISFTQLLIYKANLTETELKAENNKGFRLNPNLYLYPDNILGEIFTRVA